MVEKTNFYIIAYAALGTGLSGGDNILIELSRRWADKLNIIIKGGSQIYKACIAKTLSGVVFDICPSHLKFGRYIERVFWSIINAIKFKDKNSIVYTASDFPHDLLFGLIVKLKYSSVRWICGYYLIAPFPLAYNSPYLGKNIIRGIGYWLMQRFTLPIAQIMANVVYVTSEPEKLHFLKRKTIVVKGGVNLIPDMHFAYTCLPINNREFDAIFIGRLHYQKGIEALLEIWKKVIIKLRKAKLLIIGDGVLRNIIPQFPNTTWIKFADDITKNYYLKKSKIILHPATFDSGGMACAEGMAYGLPAVGFDLETHKTYYAKGMLKAKDINDFANYILLLLTNRERYDEIAKEAFEYIREDWNWDRKAERIYKEGICLLQKRSSNRK